MITNNRLLPLLATSLFVISTGCSSFNLPGSNNGGYSGRTQSTQYQEDRIGNHVYAGTGIGPSRLEPDTSEVPQVNVNDRVETGAQVTIGVDLSRQVALELHSADLGSAGLSPGGRVNYHIHGGSVLFYAGKNRHKFKRRGLTGYGRLGVGYLDNSVDGDVEYVKDNAAHVLFGAGLEYMTGIGLGLRLEGIAYEEDAQYAQLGLVYRIGNRPESRIEPVVEAPAPVIAPPVPAVAVVKPPVLVEPEPVDTCTEFSGTLDGVNFHSDSDKLTNDATQILEGVASRLNECDSVPVSISAHTDSVGAEAYNQALSERRAASVKSFLQSRGVQTDRMETTAYGETSPIDTNDTADGRRRNRRVELITVQ